MRPGFSHFLPGRPGLTPGVFYGAERVETVVAEAAFHRLLFFADSPATPWPGNPLSLTAFRFDYAHDHVLDLSPGPLARTDPH
jgi:hypothetical protein